MLLSRGGTIVIYGFSYPGITLFGHDSILSKCNLQVVFKKQVYLSLVSEGPFYCKTRRTQNNDNDRGKTSCQLGKKTARRVTNRPDLVAEHKDNNTIAETTTCCTHVLFARLSSHPRVFCVQLQTSCDFRAGASKVC